MTSESRTQQLKTIMTFSQPGSTPNVRSATVTTRQETITGYRGMRRPSINPCYHTKTTLFVPTVTQKYDSMTYTGRFGIGLTPDAPAYIRGFSVLDASLSPSEAQALLAELCGDIEPVVSIPNMIIELPEVLNLWQALAHPIREAFKATSKRQRMKHSASAWLAYSFGAMPLVNDIKKLIEGKRSVHSELTRLTSVPLSWTKTRKSLSPKVVSPIDLAMGFNTRIFFPDQEAYVASQSAVTQVRLSYQHRALRPIVSTPGTAAAMAAALYGWDRPLDVLLEATPYSFVVDWFFPVGDYLHALNESFFGGCLQVRNLCTCVKSKRNATIKGSMFHAGLIPMEKWPVVATVTGTTFRRYCGLPSSSSISELTTPNVRQSILGGCLVLQRHP